MSLTGLSDSCAVHGMLISYFRTLDCRFHRVDAAEAPIFLLLGTLDLVASWSQVAFARLSLAQDSARYIYSFWNEGTSSVGMAFICLASDAFFLTFYIQCHETNAQFQTGFLGPAFKRLQSTADSSSWLFMILLSCMAIKQVSGRSPPSIVASMTLRCSSAPGLALPPSPLLSHRC